MKKTRFISKLTGIILLISVLSAHLSAGSVSHIEPEKKAKTDSDQPESAKLSQISPEIVVPSYDFDFQKFDLIYVQTAFLFYLENHVIFPHLRFLFRNSYFEKLFEHHIAINAP